MDGNECTRHGRIAGQEEGLSLLDEAREPVADRIDSQVRSIISDTNDDCGRFVIACDDVMEKTRRAKTRKRLLDAD